MRVFANLSNDTNKIVCGKFGVYICVLMSMSKENHSGGAIAPNIEISDNRLCLFIPARNRAGPALDAPPRG